MAAARTWNPARVPQGAQPTGLTAEFLKNPLHFMRTHSMSPPSDSGRAVDMGTAVAGGSHQAMEHYFLKNKFGRNAETIERRENAGGIRYMQLRQHELFPGCLSLSFAPPNAPVDKSWVPIYFLPWKSLNILSYDIPAVPHSLAEWDDDEYPRFFFTAGINGCSIFAHGNPQGPTISHAGINNKLAVNSGFFWREMMNRTGSGYSAAALHTEIHSADYMWKDAKGKADAKAYKDFLVGDRRDLKVKLESPFGCVFGIRYGRSWTLYLQRNTWFKQIQFYKKADVQGNNAAGHVLRGTTTPVNVQVNKVPNRLGFMPLPSKTEKIFSTETNFSRPLEVLEMYPHRKSLGDLNEAVTLL